MIADNEKGKILFCRVFYVTKNIVSWNILGTQCQIYHLCAVSTSRRTCFKLDVFVLLVIPAVSLSSHFCLLHVDTG